MDAIPKAGDRVAMSTHVRAILGPEADADAVGAVVSVDEANRQAVVDWPAPRGRQTWGFEQLAEVGAKP